MRRLVGCAVLLAAGVFVPVYAAPEQAAQVPRVPASCVRTQSIKDWRVLDDVSIVVSTGPEKDYRVTFASRCIHAKWSVLARVDTRPAGAVVCLSRGDAIVFGRGARRAGDKFAEEERCLVQSVEPFAEANPENPKAEN